MCLERKNSVEQKYLQMFLLYDMKYVACNVQWKTNWDKNAIYWAVCKSWFNYTSQKKIVEIHPQCSDII